MSQSDALSRIQWFRAIRAAQAAQADINALGYGTNVPEGWYQAAMDQIRALRAEVEEWKEKARARQEVLVQRDAEVERLRAALQEILDHPAPSRVATVAREALDV